MSCEDTFTQGGSHAMMVVAIEVLQLQKRMSGVVSRPPEAGGSNDKFPLQVSVRTEPHPTP